jgi:hypothetical protein
MKGIFLLSFVVTFNVFAQSKIQKDLQKDFVREYCSCLESLASQAPEKILYNITETCIKNFFNDEERTKQIEQAVKESDADPTLSEYERGRVVGKQIMFNTIDDLVQDCKFYRQTLSEYKTMVMGQLKIIKESADRSIKDFRSKEGSLKDDKSKATYFSLLGVMYEYVGNKKEALKCYDQSLDAYPTTAAKGLRLLLKRE